MYARTLLIILFLISNVCFSQSFDYTYIDPCTGVNKTIQVPSSGITVTYYGQINTFQPNDFNNGTFEAWANDVYSSLGSTNPCAALVGLPTAINITQGTVYTTLGIINSLTTLADITSSVSSIADVTSGTTNILGGSVGTIGNSNSGGNGGSKSQSNNNTNVGSNQGNSNTGNNTSQSNTANGGTNTGNNTSQSNTASGGTTNSGNSNAQVSSVNTGGNQTSQTPSSNASPPGGTQGSQSTNSSGGITQQGTNTGQSANNTSNQASTQSTSNSEGGQTNITAGGTGTIASSNNSTSGGSKSSAGQKESGGKPTVIASSDFVGFNFKGSDVTTGIKATGGYTSLRWDGGAAHGILADYTSANKGPNITAFQAWIKPKSTTLVSGTLTVGFEGYGSQYITAAFGQVRSIKKVKVVYMATCSVGKVYKEAFIGTAVIVGGMYDFKFNKRFSVKVMNLFVYAPYVSYLDDVVMKSPYVMIPSIGTNIGITKRFKFNINMGSTMQINDATMNYTITCGTRLML